MTISRNAMIFLVIGVVAILIIIYAYKVDGFCNCAGFGVKVNRPTYTFWKGAYPRSASATPLNEPSKYGTWSQGCASKNFGWPQSAETPFDQGGYIDSQPYEMGSDEMRDLVRDAQDGLLNADVQYSLGQYSLDQQAQMATELKAAEGSKCCGCTPSDQPRQFQGQFIPLTAIQGAELPPGAVTAERPCMNSMGLRLRYGDGRYGDAAVGVL